MGIKNNIIFLGQLVRSRISHENIPLSAILNVTNRCNSKCPYCYAEYYKREDRDLSKEQLFSIIDKLASLGNKRMSVAGGEPLLRSDIGDIVDYIKAKDIDCIINSNGYLVPEKIAIVKRADGLVLSFDGEEAIHDENREKGSFQKVIAAIQCATENNVPLHTNTVLTKHNINSIEYVLETAKRYGFQAEFNLAIDHITTENGGGSNIKASDEEYKAALRKLIHYKKKGYPVLFSERALYYSLVWPTYRKETFLGSEPEFEHTRCSAGRFHCTVDADGSVYPCTHLMYKNNKFNILRDDSKEIFRNIDKHSCVSCYHVAHNEFNLLYAFDVRVLLNYAFKSLW